MKTETPLAAVAPRPAAAQPARAPERSSERAGGICSNCAHRFACALPVTPRAVWHCEEYA